MRVIGHEVKEIINVDYEGDFLVTLTISEEERKEKTTLILRTSNNLQNKIGFHELGYYEGPFGTIFTKRQAELYEVEDEEEDWKPWEPYERFKIFMETYIPMHQDLLLQLVNLHKKL